MATDSAVQEPIFTSVDDVVERLATTGYLADKATATSVFLIYLNSFPYLKLGYGAAMSLVLAGIILICTIFQIVLTRRSHA